MKHYIITFSAFVIVGLSYTKISRLIRASCIICVIFLNLCNLCLAQKANFRYFSVDEGLPQATVYEMLLDNEGYLWFGTQGGIARYNGRTFDVYNQQNGLAGNHVVKLYQDSKNNIWIGYRYEGVSKLVLPAPPVPMQSGNPSGNEGEGSLSKNGNHDKKGDSSPPMAELGKGFYHYKDQLRGIDNAISDILEDDLGNIWIGTKGNGIYVLNKAIKEIGEIKELTTENGFRSNNINALEKDESGNIWVGTNEGIHIINPNDPDKILKEIFLSDFGFQNNYISDIKITNLTPNPSPKGEGKRDEVERINSVWIATLSGFCELNFDSDLNIKIKNKYEDIDGLPFQRVKQLHIANINHPTPTIQ